MREAGGREGGWAGGGKRERDERNREKTGTTGRQWAGREGKNIIKSDSVEQWRILLFVCWFFSSDSS